MDVQWRSLRGGDVARARVMRQSKDRRHLASGVYLAIGVVHLVMAWVSMNVVVLAVGLAFIPLAAWAWRHYPVDRDW